MTILIKETSLGAENTFTEAKVIGEEFNFDISGSWVGTVTVQRRFPGNDTEGAHTGANNASVLTDKNQAWTADGLIGHYIKNITDGSQGVITDNTSTTITATLAGGTDNDFDLGDKYEIWRDVPSGKFTANGDNVGRELEYGVFYRAGFKTGDWTSGVATLRFSQ